MYCGVSPELERLDKNRRWFDLPELDLSPALRSELAIKMPGYQSGLHRHEWYKHGTCYSETPEEYYQETILLLDQLNASGVRTLMAHNLEQDVTDDQIMMAFDQAFGTGTGSKITMSCSRVRGENLIQELRINLQGDIVSDSAMAELLAIAPDARSGCQQGQVDSVDERPWSDDDLDDHSDDDDSDTLAVTVRKLETGKLEILIDLDRL